jgi:hypothetical protein
MERARIARYLRIAVTALSLTACVLLIVLWVRSFWWYDAIVAVSRTSGLGVISMDGGIFLKYTEGRDTQITTWQVFSQKASTFGGDLLLQSRPSFGITWDSGFVEGAVPHWILTVLAAAIAAASWTCEKWRFSLRTLLIATTLVAVGMGIIISTS